MNKNEPKLTLTVKQDRALGYHRGGSMRYLSCTVKTPEVKQEQSQDQHLNLARLKTSGKSTEHSTYMIATGITAMR